VAKLPLAYGSRLAVVEAADDDIVLMPPPPGEPIADVAAAVRDALRFPLAGQPLEALVPRGGRATIVVEPPALPIPGSAGDPRRTAIAATMTELDRAGAPFERQTLLVAAGLGRKTGHRDLELLVHPEFARRFHGRVEVHDAESPDLVDVGEAGSRPLRVHPALVEADVVVPVTAAETVLNGGAAALLAAADARSLRAADAYSLLETSASGGWKLAVELERALARRTALIGVSLTLNTPTLGGVLQGYPHDRQAVDRVAQFPLRGLFSLLPGPIRRGFLRRLPTELSTLAVFAGPPSVAHAEALLRGVDTKSTPLEEQLDVICIGLPHTTPYLPREAPNPATAAYLGLGLALRLWRDSFPVVEGGTAILLSRFSRRFPHPTQQPYRALFQALRSGGGREPDELAHAEERAAGDTRALGEYRSGRSCHPLLPFAEWSACQPAIGRLGAVLVAGCRDAHAARQMGFVPTHAIGPALAMAHARTDRPPRIGYLLSPPYFPLRVSPE
jgi:Lactate racemase N-terminal domain